jgi:MacB-like protein
MGSNKSAIWNLQSAIGLGVNMDTLLKDLRYGIRGMLKRPGFTLVALIALALGIGANTAIFSLVNAVLVQPLPFAEPDRLVWMWGNIRQGGNRASVSPLDFLDYRQQNTTFEHFAASFSVPAHAILTGNGEPERLTAGGVTGNYFQALGVSPALGRTFVLENEKPASDCEKPPAFRNAPGCSAAKPPEAKPLLLEVNPTESQRLSAREAAKPQKPIDHPSL